MKPALPYFLLFLLSLVLFAFLPKQKSITYHSIKQLTWGDFKGRVQRGSKYAANTSSGFNYSASMEGDSMRIALPTIFNPKESWVKKKQKSPHLLQHEQLHFDITELYVREMRKAILTGNYSLKTFNKSVSKILKKYSKESNRCQRKYDQETNHSILIDQQHKWNMTIKKRLEKLEEFDRPTFSIALKK